MATSYRWIKLYQDILDDPKMGRLPDHLWRRVVELFLLAGRTPERDGGLPSVDDMAWLLHIAPEALQADLDALMALPSPIIEKVDGMVNVTNFVRRQAPETDAERKAAERARDHQGHAAVTSESHPVTDTCSDQKQIRSDQEAEADQEADQTADREADAPEALEIAAGCPSGPAFALLRAFGIGEPALSKHAGLPAAMVEAWIEAIRVRQGIQNPCGLLVSCLEAGGWPPKARASPDNGDDRRRFLSGEYAEYIQH